MNINRIAPSMSKVAPQSGIARLTEDLTRSLRLPGRKTLSLIDKALSYLTPFETYGKQAFRPAATPAERRDLLTLLDTHRLILSPYLDIDRIESNLRHSTPY